MRKVRDTLLDATSFMHNLRISTMDKVHTNPRQLRSLWVPAGTPTLNLTLTPRLYSFKSDCHSAKRPCAYAPWSTCVEYVNTVPSYELSERCSFSGREDKSLTSELWFHANDTPYVWKRMSWAYKELEPEWFQADKHCWNLWMSVTVGQ